MSRVGKLPISVPKGINIDAEFGMFHNRGRRYHTAQFSFRAALIFCSDRSYEGQEAIYNDLSKAILPDTARIDSFPWIHKNKFCIRISP